MVKGMPLRVNGMITQTARRILTFAFTITVLCVVSACSSQAVVSTAGSSGEVPTSNDRLRPRAVGERAAAVALRQVGVPYRYGGATIDGFDCSGLVQYSYRQAGKAVPRTTAQLWSASATVDRDKLRAGDLLFFRIEGKMSHVGLYLGGQEFVHAPSTGRNVSVAKLTSPFYSSALIRGGRPN